MQVTPVLGFLPHCTSEAVRSQLVLSPGEVDSVFELTLEQLVDPNFQEMQDLGYRGKVSWCGALGLWRTINMSVIWDVHPSPRSIVHTFSRVPPPHTHTFTHTTNTGPSL